MTQHRQCRFCGSPLSLSFADLGMSPLSNAYLKPEQLGRMEPFYPLHAWVCESCFLVQLEEFESARTHFQRLRLLFVVFRFLARSRPAVTPIRLPSALRSDASSFVVEIASNDGYLLQYFVQRGVPVLGIEPAANVAVEAETQGRADAGQVLRHARRRSISRRPASRPTC